MDKSTTCPFGIDNRQSEIARPFEPLEKRALSLRPERIDPRYLSDGKAPTVDAEHSRTNRHAWGKARHYELTIPKGQVDDCRMSIEGKSSIANRKSKIQLNHGDLANDESRLKSIMESMLAPKPEIAELEPKVKI